MNIPWWLPGGPLGAPGVIVPMAGRAGGGPDAVGGIVYGGVSLAAAVILHRRRPKAGDDETHREKGSNR